VNVNDIGITILLQNCDRLKTFPDITQTNSQIGLLFSAYVLARREGFLTWVITRVLQEVKQTVCNTYVFNYSIVSVWWWITQAL